MKFGCLKFPCLSGLLEATTLSQREGGFSKLGKISCYENATTSQEGHN